MPRLALAVLCALAAASRPGLAAEGEGGYRRLAPGVLTVIPPNLSRETLLEQAEFFEMTLGGPAAEWTPKHAAATETLRGRSLKYEFAHRVWCLEFAFKPPRQIDLDVPTKGLKMARRRVWYLVYRVRNLGGLQPVVDENDPARRSTEAFEAPITFLPHFVLESREAATYSEGLLAYRGYLDRVVPGAAAAIREREDPARPLLDSSEMTASPLEPGEQRWGVAVWEGVDPRLDAFEIYVRGLTNRFDQRPPAAADDLDDTNRLTLESLRLDFWRPGDARGGEADEMMIGYDGLFERRTLGTTLIEAASRGEVTGIDPSTGLKGLGISWADLLDRPTDTMLLREHGRSLRPLERLLEATAAAEPAARGPALEALLGVSGTDQFNAAIDGLLSAAKRAEAGGAEAEAFERIDLEPAEAAAAPLESLAKAAAGLDAVDRLAERSALTAGLFGDAAAAFERLASAVNRARAVAAMQTLGLDIEAVAASGGMPAFEALRESLAAWARDAAAANDEPPSAEQILLGLFGAEGPRMYAAAVARRPGIDRQWVFRYEN